MQREHLDIREGKSSEEAIDYEDFKSMAFTRAVCTRSNTHKNDVRVGIYYEYE
jgi:hypothetical protein